MAEKDDEVRLWLKKAGFSDDPAKNGPCVVKTKKSKPPELSAGAGMYLFDSRPASGWISKNAGSGSLFGDFWSEGDVSVLFSDSGVGKSILAVQLAECIARGRGIGKFSGSAEPQKVLYIDFEHTAAQFARRYSASTGEQYAFADLLIRSQPSTDEELPSDYKNYGEFLTYSLQHAIESSGAEVLIVDDISWLTTKSVTSAGAGVRLMKALKGFRNKHNLSVLVLADRRNTRRPVPIELKDLVGSEIINLADSVFAIGSSTYGEDIRYIKQLKTRVGIIEHDAANVAVFRIERTSGPAASDPDEDYLPPDEEPQTFYSLPDVGLPAEEVLPVSHVRNSAIRKAAATIEMEKQRSLAVRKHSPTPAAFIGFTHLGVSPEADHLRDHTAELEAFERREQIRQLTKAGVPASTIQLIVEGTQPRLPIINLSPTRK